MNQPKKPFLEPWWPFGMGLSMVAHSAGVKTMATTTDSTMDETMVMENWR
ncbi:Uncharacterised protein [Bordetella pertussis]|nr:Uncharacterised protein [Bordetella pertussis]CFP62709.1 Uncharacterised protein [Bordetella pertussis]